MSSSNGDDFTRGVDDGLRLSKRIYFGKDRSVTPPKHMSPMEKANRSLYPVSPMLYAVISNPGIVDNPDVPSYQPHVHGRCDPPALIPLQMNGIGIEIDCYLDTAYVTMTGSWRVHCVMGSATCDCRLAIPMGLQVPFTHFCYIFKIFILVLFLKINLIIWLITGFNSRCRS